MEQSDTPQSSTRRRRWPGVLVVVMLLVGAGLGVTPFVVDVSAPPAGGEVTWPYLTDIAEFETLDGPSTDAPIPTAEGLAAILDPAFSSVRGTVAISVRDGVSGDEIYAQGATEALKPASSTKTVTAMAALASLGAGYRIPTKVVAGSTDGEVVLVAGGDVTLTRDGEGYYEEAAQLSALAEQVLDAVDGEVTTLVVDTSIFADDPIAPGVTTADIAAGNTAKLTPFMVDGGRLDPAATHYSARADDPTGFAAGQLAELLGATTVTDGRASDGAVELGVVYSPTVQRLVELAMTSSDNLLTDALARHVAIAAGQEASFAGGAAATLEVIESLGISTQGAVLSDGSGLSQENRLTADMLSMLVAAAVSDDPNVTGLAASMPVAGYSGSLLDRFDGEGAARGEVRAKTGTLSGVSSLTGLAVTADGRWVTFSIIINGHKDSVGAERALDRAAAALTDCGCM